MKELSNTQINLVSGAHNTSGILMTLIGLPHVVMGLIEFYNYFGEWRETGCGSIEDGDHFKKLFCGVNSTSV